MKRKKGLLYLLFILCLAGAAFSGWNLYKELMPRIQAENTYDEIYTFAFPNSEAKGENQELEEDRVKPDFSALLAWNPDVVGWIWSPGTDIDYPVMQGTDNDFYLNHTADKRRSIIGSIFVESNNRKEFQDDLTVIYGHHIKGGRMFSSLSGYKNQSYYEKHPTMFFYTPEAEYEIELFAGGILDAQTATFPLTFESSKDREQWINSTIAASSFRSEVFPQEGEKMVALCTCTYEFEDARYVVYGVLRPLEEEA